MNYGRLDDDRFFFWPERNENVFLQNLQKSALVFWSFRENQGRFDGKVILTGSRVSLTFNAGSEEIRLRTLQRRRPI